MDDCTLPDVAKLNALAAEVIKTLAVARRDPDQRAGLQFSARVLMDEVTEELAKIEAVEVGHPADRWRELMAPRP